MIAGRWRRCRGMFLVRRVEIRSSPFTGEEGNGDDVLVVWTGFLALPQTSLPAKCPQHVLILNLVMIAD